MGGSAAQREIVQDTLVLAAVRCGRGELARRILHSRLDRRPSPRDVQRSLGLPR